MGSYSHLLVTLCLGALLTQVAANKPPSWAIWTAKISFPADVTIQRTKRSGAEGWGVDLNISASSVDASIWDKDGDGLFMLTRGSAFCKVDVGSAGLGPGLKIEIFEQHGLDCGVAVGTGGPKDYAVTLSAVTRLDGSADCHSDPYVGTPCKVWRPPSREVLSPRVAQKPPSWSLWTATIGVLSDTSISKVPRSGDQGWGVDLNISLSIVQANVWDADGSAFFMLTRGGASCKVSVGSNGLGPGLEVEIFQQHGLVCNVASGTGGPTNYLVTLSADLMLNPDADCDSTYCPDGACPSNTRHLCNNTWHATPPPALVMV